MYIAKNHTDGADKWVIGGTLEIESGAIVIGLPIATDTNSGGIIAEAKGESDTVEVKIDSTTGKGYVPTYYIAANQADSTAIDVAGLLADFNALLAKLKAAGLMVADA
ncbi:MAG: hypothetical protein A2Y17_06005 [Clostridiales bacterium GWF2_38_85]|nr:MAG: hypothetical protein A2Y17_06005 [Clostridiales bacterium GWF2_38_85]